VLVRAKHHDGVVRRALGEHHPFLRGARGPKMASGEGALGSEHLRLDPRERGVHRGLRHGLGGQPLFLAAAGDGEASGGDYPKKQALHDAAQYSHALSSDQLFTKSLEIPRFARTSSGQIRTRPAPQWSPAPRAVKHTSEPGGTRPSLFASWKTSGSVA